MRKPSIRCIVVLLAVALLSASCLQTSFDQRSSFPIESSAIESSTIESSTTTIESSIEPSNVHVIPPKGLIVLELLGRLGNNLFEVGFGTILAKRLGWDLVVSRGWQSVLVKPEFSKCFPRALPELPVLDPVLMDYLNITNATKIDLLTRDIGNHSNGAGGRIRKWAASQDTWWCKHVECNFKEPELSLSIQQIQQSPTRRLIQLTAFFIHFDWIENYIPDIREALAMDRSCCLTQVPPDVIVLHARNSEKESLQHILTPNMVSSLMQHYNYTHRPLWIVCEPRTKDSVQALVDRFNASVQMGQDGVDAFCMLTQATTLILSESSTFSQMAAILGNATQVHYPLHRLNHPPVTILNPNWHYHRVNETGDSIIEWNVHPSRIKARAD